MARDLAIDVVTKSTGQLDMEPLSLTNGNRNSLMTPTGDLAVCSTEVKQIFRGWKAQKEGKKPQQNKNHHNNLEIHVLPSPGAERDCLFQKGQVCCTDQTVPYCGHHRTGINRADVDFLISMGFKRYMPACTHLCFWGFLSQSSNSVSWDLWVLLWN